MPDNHLAFLCFTTGQGKIQANNQGYGQSLAISKSQKRTAESEVVAKGREVMSPLPRIQKQKSSVATLLLLVTLACGSLEQLPVFNRQNQTPATETTITDKDEQLNISEAYEKSQALPGYRLEGQHVVQDSAGNRTRQTTISERDAKGNVHLLVQNPNGQQREFYFVDGYTYMFETQYEAWVNLGITPLVEAQLVSEVSPVSLKPVENVAQLLTQLGAMPTEMGHETLLNRPVTRYTIADKTAAFEEEAANLPLDLRGALWIDDQTGAVVKTELFLYEHKNGQPIQEFVLIISEIGQVSPITAPAPVVDPTAIASATATAQAQIVLPVSLDYQGEQVSFEIVPLRVTQAPDSSPRSAEVQLILRQLPGTLFQATSFEPFLGQLREQFTLSIPERNLIVTSSGFRLENSDAANHTLMVLYFFNADLEDFSHVELIVSGQGNPLFAPVPVE